MDFPAEGGQNGLVDAGLRHLRIGDDVAAGAQRLDPLRDRVVGEDEIVGIVKVGSRVDGALDDELVFRVELTVSQQLGDSLPAAAFPRFLSESYPRQDVVHPALFPPDLLN